MSDNSLRIIFAGTPDFAAVALQSIIDAGHQVCAVYCQPDRPAGRGKKLIAGPVKQLALEHHIPVEQPLNFKSEESIETLAAYQADIMVVVAYGLLLPASVLETPRLGCVNIHGSLLPRWRGAAPIQRAIQAGDTESGITIMQMDQGLDTGEMLIKLACPISTDETGSSLHDKLALLGGQAINQYLSKVSKGEELPGEVQDDTLACYAHKLSKKEAEIDWQLDAEVIANSIRAFNAWPVAFTHVGDKRLRIWQAQTTSSTSDKPAGSVANLEKSGIQVVCGDGKILLLTQLQPDGGKAMDAAALLNSRRDWFEQNPVLGPKG